MPRMGELTIQHAPTMMTTTAFLGSPLPTCRSSTVLKSRTCTLRRKRKPADGKRTIIIASSSELPTTTEYQHYMRDVAKVDAPISLQGLLYILEKTGETLIPPSTSGCHPFLVPLSQREDGSITGLLRWPTAPKTMELPIARTIPGSVSLSLQAPSATAHVTRVHASADYSGSSEFAASIRAAAPEAELVSGAVERSGMPLERYIVCHVGAFPDVYEGLAAYHLAKGDESSALIACERANSLFTGWASPHVFHARTLRDIGRSLEARDAARFALQMPLWTMGGCEKVTEMGRLAGYEDDESLKKIYRRLFEDKREKEVEEGKAPQQVALDRAAYYLDWVTVNGSTSWDDVDLEPLAELYDEAQLQNIATFVRY